MTTDQEKAESFRQGMIITTVKMFDQFLLSTSFSLEEIEMLKENLGIWQAETDKILATARGTTRA